MNEAVVVSAVRIATGKAPKGMYRTVRPDDLAVLVIKAALAKALAVDPRAHGRRRAEQRRERVLPRRHAKTLIPGKSPISATSTTSMFMIPAASQ